MSEVILQEIITPPRANYRLARSLNVYDPAYLTPLRALETNATDSIELHDINYPLPDFTLRESFDLRDFFNPPIRAPTDTVHLQLDRPRALPTILKKINRSIMAFSFGNSSSTSPIAFIINALFRFLQFVFAIAVIGLYGTDINNARKGHEHQDSRWIYAEVVASLSALTCLIFMIPGLKSYVAFGWDIVLFILWTAVFGVFASIYIHMNPNGDHNISRLKNAVWIDLINMLLWFVTAIIGAVMFWRHRNTRSTFTGRAAV